MVFRVLQTTLLLNSQSETLDPRRVQGPRPPLCLDLQVKPAWVTNQQFFPLQPGLWADVADPADLVVVPRVHQ